ncbi:MAG: sodium:calcium antiporter, partial [Chloroflexi bacterium]|nr:sodium:calcium antiporter [Chloroflexota bacterium]
MSSKSGRFLGWAWVVAATLSTAPGLALALGAIQAPDPVRALVFGVAIVGAAFLLSWAAEVAQLDFSQGLALALLALIAVLPEYMVDATFAWLAAEDPAYASYAIANMTGANRLLIGIA